MATISGKTTGKVRILSTGQVLPFNNDSNLKSGQEVLVESEGIQEPAIFYKGACARESEGSEPKFLRVLTSEDIKQKNDLKDKARSYLEEAREKTFRHGLDMKILDTDLSFDEKKLTFYFTAPGRVDFRSLVADMVGSFHRVIRLQQIGPRDQAKLFGGLGKCGRELCCAKFLTNLESVTLEMVENQEISGSKSSKMAGCCGKLMCCLSYENDLYEEIRNKMPKLGTEFKSKGVSGKVISHNLLEGTVSLETKEGEKIDVAV